MLRIWDCFLYEGRKVLYRFALGILKLYERKIMQISDANNILSYLKKLPKHIFNVEDLFDVSVSVLYGLLWECALYRKRS